MQRVLASEPASRLSVRPSADALQKVAQQMTRLGAAGLPRNYELFYEALSGHAPDLSRDLQALGAQPSQAALDEIGLRHRLVSHCGLAAETAQNDAARLLRSLSDQLSLSLTHKQTFVRALETIGRSMREDGSTSLADLTGELDFLHASVADLMLAETELGQKLRDGLGKLDATDRTAAVARTMVLRDRLTNLPNRIAFCRRLDDLYAGETEPKGTALFMVDIDQFTAINQQYGPAAGNRLLKKLAAIFRKSIKKNDFVARVGGDEFAFLFDDVSAAAMVPIADRLRASVENNLTFATSDGLGNGTLTISIGVALSGQSGSAQTLQAEAELALAAARKSRRPVVIHTPELARLAG